MDESSDPLKEKAVYSISKSCLYNRERVALTEKAERKADNREVGTANCV